MPKASKKKELKGGHRDRTPVDPAVRQKYDAERAVLEAQDAERGVVDNKWRGGSASKKSETIIKAFLIWLSKGYSPKFAANKCGIDRSTFFQWRKDDEDFARRWKEAIDEGTDVFEDEAQRRAVEGVDRPVFQMGEVVGFTREYSDSLLAMQMKGRRPERYGDKVAHTGADGGSIRHHIEVEFVKSTGEK